MEVDILRHHRINITIFLCVACLILGTVCAPKQVNAKEADVAKDVITATDSASKETLSQVGLFSSFSNANILMFNQVLKEQQLSLEKQQDNLKKEEKEQEAKKQETQEKTKEFDLSWTPLMYGILTILNVLFCSLSWFLPSRPISVVSSYTERAFNCCGMLAIITGVKYLRVRKGFALSGLILGSFSLLVLFVLFCIAAGRYYY